MGGHGLWSARRRSALVDAAIRELAEDVAVRCAIVAVGGYGREELSPGSDIDVMVLHGERRAERVREAAERIFYPFWDGGFALGHAVRTPAQSASAARERIDVACSLLDARLVSGDPSLFEELETAVRRATAPPERFLDRLRDETAERHARYGSCSEAIDPDLKEGAGGLRDIETIAWAGRVVRGARSPERLVEERILRRREATALADAKEFFVRVRSALHLSTGRRTDRLWLEHHGPLAEAFGYEPEPGLVPADALMRSVFEHARVVEHVAELAFERVSGASRGSPDADADAPPRTSADVLRVFAQAARTGARVPALRLDELQEAGVETPERWPEEARGAFLELLDAGPHALAALEAMDRVDVLTALIPEWEAVRCRPQRDPYHRFSVDVHLLRTVGEVHDLVGSAGGDAVAARAAAAVRDPDALRLGALLHDIGKTGEGGHVPRGAAIAAGVLDRMRVSGALRDDVLFLVREHLLLSDTATRRDLSDENLVLDVAARVGSHERLAMLYLLTAADARATGPHAWTPWRQALIRELVSKVERTLEREPADRTATLTSTMDAVRALLRTEDQRAVDEYLARIPRPYLLAVPPDVAARHFHLVIPPPARGDVRTDTAAGSREGTYELTVVAADRPGLLAKVAGALSLSGLSILSAQAFTTEDGVAIDLFVVEPAFHGDVDEERWRRFRSDLRKALAGRISLEYRVREKRRHYPAPTADVPTEVTVANDASDFYTVVEVSTADRIGLLFDLARTFQELELDVHLAKVATYGVRVVDAFYVRDLFGQKVEDERHVREIERAIVARLEPDRP